MSRLRNPIPHEGPHVGPHEGPHEEPPLPSDKPNRENDNTAKGGDDTPGGKIDPSEIANRMKKTTQEYFKNGIQEAFSTNGKGTKSIGAAAEYFGMDKEKIEDLKGAISTLFGKKEELPFGFKTDGSGNYIPNPEYFPEQSSFFDREGNFNVSTFLESFKGRSSFLESAVSKGGKYELNPKQQAAFKEFLQKSGGNFRENLGFSLSDEEKAALKDPDPKNKKNEAILKRLFGDKLPEFLKRKEKTLNEKEEAKGKSGSKWKFFTHLLIFMEFAGTLGAILYLLNAYSNTHTGCMRIYKINDSPEITEKVLCYSKTTYPPQLCYCDKIKGDFEKSRCSHEDGTSKTCSSTTSATEPRPAQVDCTNTLCKGDLLSVVTNYQYYAYQVMDPASAAIDIAKKGSDIATDGFEKILKAILKGIKQVAIIGGIIIGVLGIIYFVLKMVLSKKSAPSVPSAPSAVKFGNRGFLGNLSKYSNYAYMGRCAALPAAPYIPIRYR